MVVEEVEEVHEERVEIKLGNRQESKIMRESSNKFSRKVDEQDIILEEKFHKGSQLEEIPQHEEQLVAPIPMELSSRLKKVKLATKIVVIMCMYIFVFFLPFLRNSADILTVRSFYGTTSLHLVSQNGSRMSSTTVITH